MLALTVHDPWPFAFTMLGKRIENRSWTPSHKQLRPGDAFALHGGRREKEAIRCARRRAYQTEILRTKLGDEKLWDPPPIEGIFALATFGGIITESDNPWFIGPKGWVIDELFSLFHPVPARGKQGLWQVPAYALEMIKSEAAWHSLCFDRKRGCADA